jgi:hypothetical protein
MDNLAEDPTGFALPVLVSIPGPQTHSHGAAMSETWRKLGGRSFIDEAQLLSKLRLCLNAPISGLSLDWSLGKHGNPSPEVPFFVVNSGRGVARPTNGSSAHEPRIAP